MNVDKIKLLLSKKADLERKINGSIVSNKTRSEYARICKQIERLEEQFANQDAQSSEPQIINNKTKEVVSGNDDVIAQKEKKDTDSILNLKKLSDAARAANAKSRSTIKELEYLKFPNYKEMSINIEKELHRALKSIPKSSISESVTCLVIQFILMHDIKKLSDDQIQKANTFKNKRARCDKFPTVIHIKVIAHILKSMNIEYNRETIQHLIHLTLEYFFPYKTTQITKLTKNASFFRIKNNKINLEALHLKLKEYNFNYTVIKEEENDYLIKAWSSFRQDKVDRFIQENKLQ